MMTRAEILEQFKVDEYGIIQTPGKFEAEMIYAPYFYSLCMEGSGEEKTDESGAESTWFEVTDEDRDQFPELRDVEEVECYESEQGFFYCLADPRP